jgi:hypothetical protein
VADEFPDGVWFVELGDLQQPDLVVSRVAAAVGVGEEPGRPLLETLADALRPRQLLLALDNCEHLIDAWRGLPAPPASSPGLRLMATSRERCGGRRDGVAGAPAVRRTRRRGHGSRGMFRYEAIRLPPPGPRRRCPASRPARQPVAVAAPAARWMARRWHELAAAPDAVGGADRRAAGRPVRAAHHR